MKSLKANDVNDLVELPKSLEANGYLSVKSMLMDLLKVTRPD